MQTKLVYVLTCAPEATYIEQALIAVYSARYWNQSAHIVLIVDDKTNEQLVGKRGEILDYISEKIVVSFDADKNMHYRSRWLKTKVRELVNGDLLFIDSDTIIQKSLDEIDSCEYDIAMVPDEHSPIAEYPESLMLSLKESTSKLGYDILKEDLYFNSGVIYSKDTDVSHELWHKWHECWLEGVSKGVNIDQAALGKANMLCNHPIKKLDDVWNTLVYMNPIFIREGFILHFWNFRNKSLYYTKSYLDYVKNNGINDYVSSCLLTPIDSMLPFDNVLSKSKLIDYNTFYKKISLQIILYRKNVDDKLEDFPWLRYFNRYEQKFLSLFSKFTTLIFLFRKSVKFKILQRKNKNRIFYT